MKSLPRGLPFASVRRHFMEFNALRGDATFLWPRWIILRAVGLVYCFIFAGIIAQGAALLGPDGIMPLPDTLAALRELHASPIEAFLWSPGLFWLSGSHAMVLLVQWLGLLAAGAVLLNLWPRLALFICWLCFLSFVTTGYFFAATQPDQLMLEVALLCIALAPAGRRPGLGADQAPRRIAVFALRWMFIRLMLEAGVTKFIFGGDMWRDFTAMNYMHETAPFPTVFGYLAHRAPHFIHVLEVAGTWAAEIAAPLLALFAGRWGRWVAFFSWCALQLGIQVTANFGWLNMAALALGLVLLDDRMLADAARWLRRPALGVWLAARVKGGHRPPVGAWARWGLRTALALQFFVAVYFYAVAPPRIPPERMPALIDEPIRLFFAGLRSANSYALYGNLERERYEVEFVGSNDDGETWRSYEFRHKIQRTDEVAAFTSPWYPRFDAIMQQSRVSSSDPHLYHEIAAALLRRSPPVLELFRRDPFPEKPPRIVRLPLHRYEFTDLRTRLETGNYWHREYVGEFAAPLLLDAQGQVVISQ